MQSDLLMAEAILGKDAQEFLKTELGRYITGRCAQERAAALDKLSRVHPWRRNRIRQLQNEVWRADSLQDWMTELVIMGQQAEAVLEEIERDD